MEMTREEAIRIIKIVMAVVEDFEIIVQGEKFTEEKCKEAIDMVTKALEQEPCNDLISRQAAIDDLQGKDPSQIWDTADIEVWINSLPPAQSERKMG